MRRVLSIATNADDKTLLFEIVFCIVWIGGAVIAVNGQLLGGNFSFFQSICLLGYCLFPLNMAAIVNLFIGGFVHIIIKLIYVAVAFVWSTYCKFSLSLRIFEWHIPDRLLACSLFSFCTLHQGDGARGQKGARHVPRLPILSLPRVVHYPVISILEKEKCRGCLCVRLIFEGFIHHAN